MRDTILTMLVLAIPALALGADVNTDDEQILTWLKELKPLAKVHYSWPLPFKKLCDELLHEYARLTHAVSLSGEWGQPEQVERAVAICKRINVARPKIPASIGINYSVWHRRFGKDLPPTDPGPTHQAELDYLKARLETIRDLVTAANQKHDTNVTISAVPFDSERFHVRGDDPAWNKAITGKHNAAYETAREVLPGVRIEWYARGGGQPARLSGNVHHRLLAHTGPFTGRGGIPC